jgi:hypothetical protein
VRKILCYNQPDTNACAAILIPEGWRPTSLIIGSYLPFLPSSAKVGSAHLHQCGITIPPKKRRSRRRRGERHGFVSISSCCCRRWTCCSPQKRASNIAARGSSVPSKKKRKFSVYKELTMTTTKTWRGIRERMTTRTWKKMFGRRRRTWCLHHRGGLRVLLRGTRGRMRMFGRRKRVWCLHHQGGLRVLPCRHSRSTKGIIFEDAPTTTVHLQIRSPLYCYDV